MISYLVDEISGPDMLKVREFLSHYATASGLKEIFWMPVPAELLRKDQWRHEQCKPHVFAVETGRDFVKMEMYIRSRRNMRCTCQGYCSAQQRKHIIHFAHEMIESLGIRT